MVEEPATDYLSNDLVVELTHMLDGGRAAGASDLCTRALRDEAVEKDEGWRGFYLTHRAWARMVRGIYPQAILDLEKGIELLPMAVFHLWLGEAQSRDGRYGAAISTFKRLLNAGVPQRLMPWVSLELAIAQRASGRLGDALATVERYRDRRQQYHQHRLLRYEILLELNPAVWAKEAARRAGGSQGGIGLFVAAKAQQAQGNMKEARKLWEDYIEWHQAAPLAHPFWRKLAIDRIKPK